MSRTGAALKILMAVAIALLVGRAAVTYAGRGVDFLWDAGVLILRGENPYSATAAGVVVEPRLQPVMALYFPSALVLVTPFALLPFEIARWWWLGAMLAMSAGAVWLLFPVFLGRRGTLGELLGMGLALAAGAPWAIGVGLGQYALMALFFYLLAIRLAQDERWGLAGLALAVAAFKYVLVAPLALFFVWRRWYRALAVAVGCHVGLHVAVAWHLDVEPLALIRQPLELARVVLPLGGFMDFIAIQRFLEVYAPGARGDWWMGVSAVILGVLTLRLFWRLGNDVLYLTTLCWLGLIALYHPVYDYVLLLVPLFLAIYRREKFDATTRALVLSGVAALWYGYRLTSLVVTLVPPPVAAPVARAVLILLVALTYTVALRLAYVLIASDPKSQRPPIPET